MAPSLPAVRDAVMMLQLVLALWAANCNVYARTREPDPTWFEGGLSADKAPGRVPET